MLQRKREAIKMLQSEVSMLPDTFSKRKLLELCAEEAAFETCLDLAKVMFNGEKEDTATHQESGGKKEA